MGEKEVVRLEEQIKTLFENDKRHDMAIDKIYARIDVCLGNIDAKLEKLSNRLPVWTTALIALLTATCGWLAAK